MRREKISGTLAARLDASEGDEMVEVVLELNTPDADYGAASSRSARVAAAREAFGRVAAPVEDAVRRLGGEVGERAWINQTLLARMPAQSIGWLTDDDHVSQVDLPGKIEAE